MQCVLNKYVFLFIASMYLMIYFLGERDIALQDQDISLDNENSDLSGLLDISLAINVVGQKHFKCYVCEDLDCPPSNICNNAITVKIYHYSVS